MNKKNIVLLISLLTSYILVRIVFINSYTSYDVVDGLALLAGALTCIYIIKNEYITAFFTCFGYITSFMFGIIFNKIAYVSTDSVWVIWIITYILMVVIGKLIEMFHVKHKEKADD